MKLTSCKSSGESGLRRVGGVRLIKKRRSKHTAIYGHKDSVMEQQFMEDERNAEEINNYLRKLQEMVPWMPNDKKVSKVEVIDQVIDYIHELRMALGLPPCPTSNNNVDMQLMQSTIRMLPNLVNTSSDNLRNNRVQNYSSSNVSINSISPSSRNFLCPQPQKNCPILCNHNSLNISERK